MGTWKISADVAAATAQLVATRRELHKHPEIGFEEIWTSAYVAKALRETGLEVTEGVAKTGVVGLLKGSRPGPTVLWRADMDALPVQEENEVEYRSQIPGRMHACGHDAHTAIGLSLARLLSKRRGDLPGAVKFIFQPAEEGPGGARPMVEAGVLKNPTVDAAFGLHMWNELPAGSVGVRPGPMLAFSDRFVLTFRGRGGHGAAPHQTRDPIVAAAHFIAAAQAIVSRTLNPLDPGIVTVAQIHAGTAFNIIPDKAELGGTVRALRREVRDQIRSRIREIAEGQARAWGVEAELEYREGYPATINDAAMSALARTCAAEVVGADKVVEQDISLGGEDMSYFLERAPGCYFVVGSSNADKGIVHPHHHPRFNVDEDVLPLALEVAMRVVTRRLQS